ncbi:hypothetical protein M8C21_014637 [Ambrosia artemisiifolia]|uniref:Uncharacterized protein n=1 Tax=Ambrosia artemisiifolia TaxID=4212 RepID=A0AAD5BMQ3_AMBAR|nr:hypothetical protein M8C21_014637 [Ambrosia artemisiifolia]
MISEDRTTLPTMMYLPLASGFSKAKICAAATSLTSTSLLIPSGNTSFPGYNKSLPLTQI